MKMRLFHLSLKVCTHGQHFPGDMLRVAGEQLTITDSHHHEGAPLTVALMSAQQSLLRVK